jgi:hypothetical protein
MRKVHNSAGKGVQSFDADGFTLGQESDATGGTNNNLGSGYVAWNWKANGSGVSNTDGTITSTVSANTDQRVLDCDLYGYKCYGSYGGPRSWYYSKHDNY